LSFILGLTLGSIVTYSIQAKTNQQFINSYQQESAYKEFERCNRAYFQKSPEIAIWELGNFIDDTMLLPKMNTSDPLYSLHNLNLFIVHARLAKLYQNLGDREKSEQYFQSAITNYNEASRNFPGAQSLSISNDADVLNLLQKFDAKMKK
jgi:tetratricopeptide (TPR) repeat protein